MQPMIAMLKLFFEWNETKYDDDIELEFNRARTKQP
jgi:hypothetical protein